MGLTATRVFVPNFMAAVKLLLSYGDLSTFFQMAAIIYLGLVIRPFGPCIRRVLGGLYRCVKLGWNRYSSFGNMQVYFIFCEFGLKMRIHGFGDLAL